MPMNLDWRDVPVADLLEERLGLPVVVEHTVRAMALAEARAGLGRGLGSVAFVYLRTGLGAGLVVAAPELILLGGAFAHVPDSLVDRLADETRDAVFPLVRPAVRIQRSSLPQDAGVDGAATVALDHFFYG